MNNICLIDSLLTPSSLNNGYTWLRLYQLNDLVAR